MAMPKQGDPALKESQGYDVQGAQEAATNDRTLIQRGKEVASGEDGSRPDWVSKNWYNRKQEVEPDYFKNMRKVTGQESSNGLTPEQTLRRSRLADALNNREYWQAGVTDEAGNVVNPGSWQRKAPIDTTETRQQQRNEGYESMVQQSDIMRQARAKGYGLELQKMLDEYANDVAKQNDLARLQVISMAMGVPIQELMAQINLASSERGMAYNSDYTYLDILRRLNKMQDPNLNSYGQNLLGQLIGTTPPTRLSMTLNDIRERAAMGDPEALQQLLQAQQNIQDTELRSNVQGDVNSTWWLHPKKTIEGIKGAYKPNAPVNKEKK